LISHCSAAELEEKGYVRTKEWRGKGRMSNTLGPKRLKAKGEWGRHDTRKGEGSNTGSKYMNEQERKLTRSEGKG